MCAWSGYGIGWGMGWGMMFMWLGIALVIGAIWAIWAWSRSRRGAWSSHDPAKRVLRERYARGEIDGDTFQQMVAHLRDHGARKSPAA